MKYTIIVLTLLLLSLGVYSQMPRSGVADIYLKIKKINVLANVLYVAAHPDDENTALISELSNHKNARVAYLSLTRGDGGQNLIGDELGEALGIIRTQELLEARKIDGGQQFFTRAVDFGYSKSPKETLTIWNKDSLLTDILSVFKTFRPDIIINRFNHRTPRTTHGHHTTSAMLSLEAFDLAQFNAQKPLRLFYNTSWWQYGSKSKFEALDKSHLFALDVGSYNPLMGMSNTEIASLSRSQHRSQGFGVAGYRGEHFEYLEFIKGKAPRTNDIFDGLDTTWSRIKGGKAIGEILKKVEDTFNFTAPSEHLPDLTKAYTLIKHLEDKYWREIKSKAILDLIKDVLGLYMEASTPSEVATRGEKINLKLEIVNRSYIPVNVRKIAYHNHILSETIEHLNFNKKQTYSFSIQIPNNSEYTTPYWVLNKKDKGHYLFPKKHTGKPQTTPSIYLDVELELIDEVLIFNIPLYHKTVNPAYGEIKFPLSIVPKVSISSSSNILLFNTMGAKDLTLNLNTFVDMPEGKLSLNLPPDWYSSPKNYTIRNSKNDRQRFEFKISPPNKTQTVEVNPSFEVLGKKHQWTTKTIDYEHIDKQFFSTKKPIKLIASQFIIPKVKIGYIMGAGDLVMKALSDIGFDIEMIELEQINADKLQQYGCIITGIRAYNVHPELVAKQALLLDYVKKGGTLIVQYNTSSSWRPLNVSNLAPFSLQLSRNRVTNEHASVTFIDKTHPILNTPNKIHQGDFEHWVQERGLYFPNKWDQRFSPILSMADPKEEQQKGSLLVTSYGKGHYIYTGLSFFRQLPNGVIGAYKLLSNMISIGQENK